MAWQSWRALRNLDERGARAELEPSAVARAQELAEAAWREGYGHGGSITRVVLVPLLGHRLLDAVTLDDGEFPTCSQARRVRRASSRRVRASTRLSRPLASRSLSMSATRGA